MIVPRTRFIVLTAILLLPTALLAAGQTGEIWPVVWTTLGFLGMALWDAASGRRKVAGLSVSVPEVSRVTVDHDAGIMLKITKPPALADRARMALALSPGMASDQADLYIDLAADEAAYVVRWPCRALRRGKYVVVSCHLEFASRWGLWAVRRAFPLNGEIRAYPNLVSGQHHLRGLFRRREWGLRTQRRVGKGREFEQLRDYLPGDSYEDIDWKATARRRHPVTRVFQVEQAQEIYVVLDASRLSTRSADFVMNRRRRPRQAEPELLTTIFERYITAALVMAVVADQVADRFGLLIFGDRPDCFIKAGRGRAHYNACRDALYNRMPQAVSPDFDELFSFVGSHLRKRALLVFLTSLDDPMLAESFIRTMQAATRRHVLVVNMFRPPGAHPLFSSRAIRGEQGIYQHLVGHLLWSSLYETRRRLRQQGVGFSLLDKDALCSQLVNQYMEIKQRQIL